MVKKTGIRRGWIFFFFFTKNEMYTSRCFISEYSVPKHTRLPVTRRMRLVFARRYFFDLSELHTYYGNTSPFAFEFTAPAREVETFRGFLPARKPRIPRNSLCVRRRLVKSLESKIKICMSPARGESATANIFIVAVRSIGKIPE